jgi:hypothetical protein
MAMQVERQNTGQDTVVEEGFGPQPLDRLEVSLCHTLCKVWLAHNELKIINPLLCLLPYHQYQYFPASRQAGRQPRHTYYVQIVKIFPCNRRSVMSVRPPKNRCGSGNPTDPLGTLPTQVFYPLKNFFFVNLNFSTLKSLRCNNMTPNALKMHIREV